MKYEFATCHPTLGLRIYRGSTLTQVRRRACRDLAIAGPRALLLTDDAGREIAVHLEEGLDWERGPGPNGRVTGSVDARARHYDWASFR